MDRMNEKKKYTINTIMSLVCSFLQKGIGFILIPLFTRLLTLEEYGEYTTFLTWNTILSILTTLNLSAGVYTKGVVQNKTDADDYTMSLQMLTTLSGCLVVIYVSAFGGFLENFIGLSEKVLVLVIAQNILYNAYSFWITRMRVEYQYKRLIMSTLVHSIGQPLLCLFFIQKKYFENNGMNIIIAYLLFDLVFGMVFYILNLLRSTMHPKISYCVEALRFNIPLIPHYLSVMLLAQSDRIMITKMVGTAQTAMYSVAYQIASILNVVLGAIEGVLIPWTYKVLFEKDEKVSKLKNINTMYLSFVAMLIWGTTLFAPEMLNLIGGKNYVVASEIMPILSLGIFYQAVYGRFCNFEFYVGKTIYVTIATTIAAVSNIVMNYFGIIKYGYQVAAYTTFICYLIQAFMHYIVVKRILDNDMEFEKLFDIKKCIIVASIMHFGVKINVLLYDAICGRLLLLFIFCVAIMTRKKQIRKFLYDVIS